MRYFLAIIASVLAAICLAQSASKYAQATSEQSKRSLAISNELMEMIRQGEKDPTVIGSVGNRYVAELDRAIALVQEYRKATTRFGLQSEVDDFTLMYGSLSKGQGSIAILTNLPISPPTQGIETHAVDDMFREDIVPLIKDFVDLELNAQGAGDFLTDPGFDTAKAAVSKTIELRVRDEINAEIRQITGVGIRLDTDLKTHLLFSARSWVSSKIGNVVLRFAASHFVVEFLGTKILEWIGPKLREFLRPKGNLESRVDRCLEHMKQRQNTLNSMNGATHMRTVRRHVEAAQDVLNQANKNLRSDLQKSGNDALYKKLADGEIALLDAIKLTQKRFLMNSPLAQAAFEDIEEVFVDMRKRVRNALDEYLSKNNEAGQTATYHGYVTYGQLNGYPGKYTAELTLKTNSITIRILNPEGELVSNLDYVKNADQPSTKWTYYHATEPVFFDGSTVKEVKLMVRFDKNGIYKVPLEFGINWEGKVGLSMQMDTS